MVVGNRNMGGSIMLTKDDERLGKFKKMLKMHLPREAVKTKMAAEGFNTFVIVRPTHMPRHDTKTKERFLVAGHFYWTTNQTKPNRTKLVHKPYHANLTQPTTHNPTQPTVPPGLL